MGGRLRHGSCTAGCGKNERAAVGEPDAEHFNGAGDSFQIQSGRNCVLRTKQDAAGCPAERGTGGVQVLDFWEADGASFIGLSVSGLRYTVVHKGKAHQGEAAGPGLTYGYAWPLSKRFNLEFSAGVGALWYREKKYPEGTYLKKEEYNANGVKCVPTELAVSCCYLF